jgi:hypothetical protein
VNLLRLDFSMDVVIPIDFRDLIGAVKKFYFLFINTYTHTYMYMYWQGKIDQYTLIYIRTKMWENIHAGKPHFFSKLMWPPSINRYLSLSSNWHVILSASILAFDAPTFSGTRDFPITFNNFFFILLPQL